MVCPPVRGDNLRAVASGLFPVQVDKLRYSAEFQWLEHRWLVYYSYFELLLESLETFSITGDIILELDYLGSIILS